MRVLNLSLDQKILDKESRVSQRVSEYGVLVDRYDVIVPSFKDVSVALRSNVNVCGVSARAKLVQALRMWKKARQCMKEVGYDVVTCQDPFFLGLIGVRLSKKYQAGLEVQVHGFGKQGVIRNFLMKYTLKEARSVRVVSQRAKKLLITTYQVQEHKIVVVPIYVDVERDKEMGKIRSGGDVFTFLSVQRLVPVKRVDVQLRSIAKLAKEQKNIRLTIVGDGPYGHELAQLAKDLDIVDYVKFVGWKKKKELEACYMEADSFLLTSDSEGWGMVVVEAASHGLPIVMTDVGCAGELIKDEESGLVVPVASVEAVSAAMKRVLESDELQSRLSAGARAAIQALPTKQETFSKYLLSWKKAAL